MSKYLLKVRKRIEEKNQNNKYEMEKKSLQQFLKQRVAAEIIWKPSFQKDVKPRIDQILGTLKTTQIKQGGNNLPATHRIHSEFYQIFIF